MHPAFRTVLPSSMPLRFYPALASVGVSSVGDGMRLVTFPLLAASLTDDARQVALVSLAGLLPWLVVGIMSGALADRVNRRHILWIVDAMRTVVMAVLAWLTAHHGVSIPLLAASSFLLGCGSTFYNAAWVGLIPVLVDPDDVPRANAWINGGGLLTGNLVGSPVGALLFSSDPALPLAADSMSFLLSTVCILTLPAHFVAHAARPAAGTSQRGGALAGLSLLWRDRVLRDLCAVASVANFVVLGVMSVLVLYARQTLGLNALGYALLVMAFAVGGLLGVPLAPRSAARFGLLRVLGWVPLLTGLVGIGLGAATSRLVAFPLVVVYGTVSLIWDVSALSLRQSAIPKELISRLTMAYRMVTVTVGALGPPVASLLFQGIGPQAPFFAGAVFLLLCGFVLRPPSGKHRRRLSPVSSPASRLPKSPVS